VAEPRVETVLQRLDAVEEEQHAASHHRFGERLGLGASAVGRKRDAKLGERPVEKFVCRRCALFRALVVKRPAEHRLGTAIAVGLQALEPLVDQRRLARTTFGDK
jgi:hypothetical protein